MRGADLVVPVGADQQQMPHLRMGDQVLQEVERRCIKPLQIIEEQRERVLLARKHAEEAPENHLKAACASCGGRSATGGWVPMRSSSSGMRLTMSWPFGPSASLSAARHGPLRLALGEKRAHEALEGLRQGGVRDVALVLVELAGREQAARRYECLVQLVHHRGLADAGIAGDQHELGRASGHDTVEGGEQGVDLGLPPIQLLWDPQSVRRVGDAQRERIDAAGRFPFRQAPPKIGLDACGGLVALLGGLGEELHCEQRQRLGTRARS